MTHVRGRSAWVTGVATHTHHPCSRLHSERLRSTARIAAPPLSSSPLAEAHRDAVKGAPTGTASRGALVGENPPEIVACVTAHAAIDKACDMLGIRLIKVRVRRRAEAVVGAVGSLAVARRPRPRALHPRRRAEVASSATL